MKLRLPSKLQAALIATLASAALTTLSTGATAQAATVNAVTLSDWEGYDATTAIATVGNLGNGTINHGEFSQPNQGWNSVWNFAIVMDADTLKDGATYDLITTTLFQNNYDGYINGAKMVVNGTTATVTNQGWKNNNTSGPQEFSLEGVETLTFVMTRTGGSSGNVVLKGYKNGDFNTAVVTAAVPGVNLSFSANIREVYVGALDGLKPHSNVESGVYQVPDADIDAFGVMAAGYQLAGALSAQDLADFYTSSLTMNWNGTSNGEWSSTAQNWLLNNATTASAYGVPRAHVVFGSGETLAKTVEVKGDLIAGSTSVEGNYTFNMTGNLNAGKITITQGASLERTGNGTLSGTLSGAGTYVLKTSESTLGSVTLGTDWTGTVKVTKNDLAPLDLNTFGNANSTVEIDGWSKHLANRSGGYTFNPKLRLGTNGLTVSDGYSGYSYTFAGGVEGTGNFNYGITTRADTQTYIFTGDVSKWSGAYVSQKNKTSTIKFYGSATEMGAAITRTDGTLNMEVGDGTNAFTTTFKQAVSASKLAINNKASATFEETLTLTGSLTLDGSATLEKGGSIGGSIDLSHGGAAHGTLTLAAGKTLTYSSFWGANNNKLLLGEGATVKQANNAPIEIVGLAGESYVSSSANKQFSLSESAYTLHNVQATIKSASDDVQLHFDNSKLVTDQTITLKNLQSVFSGVDIKGGTTTVGASGASGTVTLGAVTLSGGNLALADLVTGNVSSIDVTATGAISGGTLSMGGTITTQADARLTLGGTVLFANGGIATSGSGTLDFADDVMFDIRQLTEGENHTYTLFTGSGADLLTRFGDTAGDHIAGAVTAGRKWFFNDNGQAYYELLSRDLVWNGGAGIWTTETSEEPWHENGQLVSTYFSNDDAVTFMYSAAPAVATLGSDVTVSTMTLDEDTPDVTVNNDGTHSFSVEELDIKSGRLTTNTDMDVKRVTIAEGGVWNVGGDLDLTAIMYSNAGKLNVMDGATVTISKDTDTSAVTGEGILDLSVGTEVIQGYAPTFKAGSPFTGTLVYNEGNIGNHNSYVTLDDTFRGTLELHGRMDGHSMTLGGATTLRLVGDRTDNTTGVWSHGSNMTLALNLEVTGDNTVDLWGDATTIINGTVNSGTVKQGHLNKIGNGTMTFNGAVALAEFTTPGGTVNFNSSADLDRININGGNVNLAGGAEADYSLGQAWISGGNLAIGANGVKSLTAADLVVRSSNTLSSAAAEPTEFNVTRFDVSNHNTNFTLQNVELNVSGAATAAELNTAQNEDQATVTVGDKATLNLGGGVVWNKQDTEHSKLDYVNLTIANGGEANVNGGTGNILNDVTVNAGGKLNFASNTGTEIAGTLALADTITNGGNVAINSGSVAAGQVGTLTGTGTYTIQGTVAAEGTLKLDGTTVSGAGTEAAPAALTGNVDINGGTIGGTLNIGSSGSTVSILEAFSVANGAKLSFNGHVVLDALEATAEEHYIHGEQDDDNGFLSGISVKVYTPGENVDVIFPGGITYKGADVYDYAESGTFSTSSVNYTTFFVNAAGTTESLDHALAAAEGHGTMTTVQLANGTSLAMDHADATLQHLVLTEGASATLNVTKNATITTAETGNGLTLTGNGALTLGANGNDASLSGAGTLTINGPTVTVNGTNKDSFSANIDVVSGTLKLGDSSDEGHWTNRSALGELNWAADSTRTITIHSGAVVDINGKTDNNYVYTLDGGTLTNTGTGLGSGSSQTAGLILTANSFVGDSEHNSEFWLRQRGAFDSERTRLELNGYNLTKRGTGTFGLNKTTVTGTGYLVVESGTVQVNNGTFGANLRMAGGTVAGTLNLAGNITIDTTEDSTISAVIAGSGKSITKTGDGTLTLSGANTYTGATTVSAGTLQFNQGFNFGSTVSGAGNITYGGSANGTLNFSNKDISGWTGSFNNTGSAVATLNITKDGHVKAAIGNEQGGTINITSERDVYFDNVVNINDISHNTSHTLYVGTDSALGLAGEMTVTGHASTGRLVVGETKDDSAAVFTLSGENARLSNGNDHTYGAKVQGYGTFAVVGGAYETLTGDLVSSPGPGFHGTFAADGAGSILTLNTTFANDVTLKATNGGVINLMKSYTMGDNTAVDGGSLTVSSGLVVNGTVDLSKGTLTQTGGTVTVNADMSLTLGEASITSAITNNGAVTFTKDITATGLAKEGEDVSYRVGADDNKSTNGNYFFLGERTESTLRVVTGGTVNPGGHKVTQGGFAYTLASDGTATGVSADEVNYYIFYQSEAGTTLNVSDIAATSEKHGAYLSQVAVDSANLVVDQSVAYVQLVNASVTNTVNAGNIDNLQVAGGDNTLVGSVTSLSAMTQFVQGAASSLEMRNATATPYQVNAGNDIIFADTGSVTVRAAVAEAGSEQFDVYALDNSRFTVEANTMQAMNTGNVTVDNHLKVASIATGGAGSLTLANGVEETLKNVTALNGDIKFMNMAEARGTTAGKQTQVGLDSLYIGSSKTVSFYENGIVDAANEVSVTVSGTLTAGVGAQLNADLVMEAGSSLDVSGTGGMGLLMGSDVTLNHGNILAVGSSDVDSYLREYFGGSTTKLYTLYSGKEGDPLELYIGSQKMDAITFDAWNKPFMDASSIYSNLQEKTYYLVYNPNHNNVGMVAIGFVPEPTTSTLSLLALAALAARRRRK